MSTTVLDTEQIRRAIDERRFSTLFEPTYSLRTGQVVGFEAHTLIARSPAAFETWVAAAKVAGLGPEFELAATRHALGAAAGLDDALWLGIRLSPETMTDPRASELLATWASPLRLTADLEHEPGAATGQVTIDPAVTRGVTTSRRSRRQARRIITRAHRRGLGVVAEGVETPAQLRRLGQLGVDAVRGLLLAAPSSLPTVLAAGSIAAQSPRTGRTASRGPWRHTGGHVDRSPRVPELVGPLRARPGCWDDPRQPSASRRESTIASTTARYSSNPSPPRS